MHSKVDQMYQGSFIFPIVYCMKDLDKAIDCSHSNVIFLGRILNILNAKRIVQYVKQRGKIAIVDVDLVGGLSQDEYVIHFIANEVGADGIISTHRNTINRAKRKKLVTVLKVFAYDEYSLGSAFNTMEHCEPDILEILPGVVLPYLIDKVKEKTDIPVNASGLMEMDAQFIKKLWDIGVSAIHHSDPELWDLDIAEITRQQSADE